MEIRVGDFDHGSRSTDYEPEEFECPVCEHYPTHSQQCNCDDGVIEDDDPFWNESTKCSECNGIGWQCWCPNCGIDLRKEMMTEKSEEVNECYP